MSSVITNIAICLLALLASGKVVFADFQCTANVSYAVRMKEAKEDMIVEHGSTRAAAPTEDLAKQALSKPLRELKLNARTACKDAHENLSGCIGAKFESMASVLQRLPFSSRRSVEDAITKDCEAQMGTCKEVKTETSCKEHAHEEGKASEASSSNGAGDHH